MVRSLSTQAAITLWLAGAVLGGIACSNDDISGPNGSDRSFDSQSALSLSPAEVPLYRQVTASLQHSCGLTPDSLAYCWGRNAVSRPVAVPGGLRFRQISAGFVHTCGLDSANRAYCWGRGPVGDGTYLDRPTP